MTQMALVNYGAMQPDADAVEYLQLVEEGAFGFSVADVAGLSDADKLFTVWDGEHGIDKLFTDVQAQLHDGVDFSQTRLAVVVRTIASQATGIAFWYGDDRSDLDLVMSVQELLRRIEIAIHESQCEAYVAYRKTIDT